MHEVVAILLIASILNKNSVQIRLGGLCISLDLWAVLLSGSGCGRSTLLTLAGSILDRAELSGIVHSASWGSAQALFQYLGESPNGLFVWGELSEKLKLLSDSRFQGAKQWLTDRYDNFRVPENIRYRETGNAQRDTPPIQFSKPPRTNILASSSEEWFFDNLLTEDSTGGFLPRWLLLRADSGGRVVPIPETPNESLIPGLAEFLRGVNGLRGDVDLSLIEGDYAQWYREARTRFSSQPNRALAEAYFNRHRIQILKLAVIFEVSTSRSLRVSRTSWTRAVEFASQLEAVIFSLLATGMSGSGHKMNQMVDRIHGAGEEGLARSEFTRAFQHMDKQQRDNMLTTLVSGETVFAFTHQTQGESCMHPSSSGILGSIPRPASGPSIVST